MRKKLRDGLKMTTDHSDAFVFFGATGDLAFKQIFPALQAMIRHGHLDMPIIGVARSAKGLDGLRARAHESLEKNGGVDPRAFAALSAKLQFVNGDYNSPKTFCDLRKALGAASRPLYYLAIPPNLFETVAHGLASAGATKGPAW
jgi:glucose-6-phosphate 1-dehydrogenase